MTKYPITKIILICSKCPRITNEVINEKVINCLASQNALSVRNVLSISLVRNNKIYVEFFFRFPLFYYENASN